MKEIKNEYRFTLTHCLQQSKRKELNTSSNSSAGLQKSERAFSRYQVALNEQYSTCVGAVVGRPNTHTIPKPAWEEGP